MGSYRTFFAITNDYTKGRKMLDLMRMMTDRIAYARLAEEDPGYPQVF